MILFTILVAAAAVTLSAFWNDIKVWMTNTIQKIIKGLKNLFIGGKVFIKKVKEAFQEIAKLYEQDEKGNWFETTHTKQVNASEVPEEIRKKARVLHKEVDITNELERELQLVL
mgnify:CR=1 FL=1|jgi:hypothetical protein